VGAAPIAMTEADGVLAIFLRRDVGPGTLVPDELPDPGADRPTDSGFVLENQGWEYDIGLRAEQEEGGTQRGTAGCRLH
jgi:hypothetical protein